jgi:hypothetical protein
LPAQVVRQCIGETLPLRVRIVAEKMIRRGLHAVQIEIVKPVAELMDAPANLGHG